MDNYYSDYRVRSADRDTGKVDIHDMSYEVTAWDRDGNEHQLIFPMKWEVCDVCEGKGKHVNPSVDCNGLGYDDFADDPDFYEDYVGGMYDVTCYCCKGRTTVPAIDESRADPEDLRIWHEHMDEMEDFRRMQEAERRFGA